MTTNDPTAANWTVLRHGGSAVHRWRVLYSGAEDSARKQYEAEAKRLRQGAVVLQDHIGTEKARCNSPRVRTRW